MIYSPLRYLELLCVLHLAGDERVTIAHVYAAFDYWTETQQ